MSPPPERADPAVLVDAPAIVVMKAGLHAGESLAEILVRKQQEERDVGFAYWGYSGSLCRPAQVRAFVSGRSSSGGVLALMPLTASCHRGGAGEEAREFSGDGGTWASLPAGAHVRGSRFALVLQDLRHEVVRFDLDAYRVATGSGADRVLSHYLRNRTDKACAKLQAKPGRVAAEFALTARLVEPWAVELR